MGIIQWIPGNSAEKFKHIPRSVGAKYATGDQWRYNSRKNEYTEPKQKTHPVVDVTGDGSKVRCCKVQYCIGTWNVRSMNQGKLEVVKQEMARVNVDILGISELKGTGMGEFNSDDRLLGGGGGCWSRTLVRSSCPLRTDHPAAMMSADLGEKR